MATTCAICGAEIAWTTVTFGTLEEQTSVAMWMSGDLIQTPGRSNSLTSQCSQRGPLTPPTTHFPGTWLTAVIAENFYDQ